MFFSAGRKKLRYPRDLQQKLEAARNGKLSPGDH